MTRRTTVRRAGATVVVLVAFLLLTGCSLLTNTEALDDAGYSVTSVSVSTTNGASTLEVGVTAPAGSRSTDDAANEAARILWQNHPGRIDTLVVDVDGYSYSGTDAELEAAYGPRDPALDRAGDDRLASFGAVGLVALVVSLGVLALTVALMVRRARGPRPPESLAGDVPPAVGGPPAGDPTAVVLPRIGAFLIDYLIWAVPGGIVWGATVFVIIAGVSQEMYWSFLLAPVGGLVVLGWGWFAYAWWPARTGGATIGMRCLGLRVVTLEGGPVPLGTHTWRWSLLAVDAFLYGLVGLIVIASSRRHQRVGDMSADTLVVRSSSGVSPEDATVRVAPHPAPAAPPLPADGLRRQGLRRPDPGPAAPTGGDAGHRRER